VENDARVSWGPRGGRPVRRLSRARAAILAALEDQPEPVTIAALQHLTRLHENTLREHLDGLIRAGLVRRRLAGSRGRGRPAWLYEHVDVDPTAVEYAGLAAALAHTLAATSADPSRDAASAGEAWGQELAGARVGDPLSAEAARVEVLHLMSDLGFEPQVADANPADIRLTRCPLLEAAHRYPEVVCAVHLGLVRGAMAAHGADVRGTALHAFSEPGACLLVVPPVSEQLPGTTARPEEARE
jgi:predicted ArsR family transcriptional regulator